MILKKLGNDEDGYLLLESIVTLSIIVTLLLSLYPLIVDWLVLRDTERDRVDQTRILYEESIEWRNIKSSSNYDGYDIQTHPNGLKIKKKTQTIGVEVYEVKFKY